MFEVAIELPCSFFQEYYLYCMLSRVFLLCQIWIRYVVFCLPVGWKAHLCIWGSRQQVNNRYWVALKGTICCDQVQLEFVPWTDEDSNVETCFQIKVSQNRLDFVGWLLLFNSNRDFLSHCRSNSIPYARHYKPRLVYFLPHFQRPFLCF